MAKAQATEPKRKPDQPAGLSGDQENALLAIEMAMSEMKAHGDEMSQWRLAQIERAIEALDRGDHRLALSLVERARTPRDRMSPSEHAVAKTLARRIELDQLRAQLTARRR